jgi:hypothetical protein
MIVREYASNLVEHRDCPREARGRKSSRQLMTTAAAR